LQGNPAVSILKAVDIAPERRALVTGGASGFGLAIARGLLEHGARVAILDVSQPALDAAASELGDGVLALQADVRSQPTLRAAVERCQAEFAGLDTLVICAGVIYLKPLADVTEEDWDRVIDVNLKGAFLTAQAAAPALSSSGRGRVVSIGSDVSKRGCNYLHAYTASKFGLVGLTESLAAELAPDGVTVNCVCPVGCPTTGMGQQVAAWKSSKSGRPAEEVIAAAGRTNPLGRNATEDDIANTALFLISEGASFLTGLAIDVDGGSHIGFLPGM
jgi:meso-butanediol dehydrogenase / (S,S)-butanediol dehydrogenase / diacetyl reductase